MINQHHIFMRRKKTKGNKVTILNKENVCHMSEFQSGCCFVFCQKNCEDIIKDAIKISKNPSFILSEDA